MVNSTISQREQIRKQIAKEKDRVWRLEQAPVFYQGYIDRRERLPGTKDFKETAKVVPILIERSKEALAKAVADLSKLKAKLKALAAEAKAV
jgi:hypothetical protein